MLFVSICCCKTRISIESLEMYYFKCEQARTIIIKILVFNQYRIILLILRWKKPNPSSLKKTEQFTHTWTVLIT